MPGRSSSRSLVGVYLIISSRLVNIFVAMLKPQFSRAVMIECSGVEAGAGLGELAPLFAALRGQHQTASFTWRSFYKGVPMLLQ
eukprot:296949-Amphidinium_carterae.1